MGVEGRDFKFNEQRTLRALLLLHGTLTHKEFGLIIAQLRKMFFHFSLGCLGLILFSAFLFNFQQFLNHPSIKETMYRIFAMMSVVLIILLSLTVCFWKEKVVGSAEPVYIAYLITVDKIYTSQIPYMWSTSFAWSKFRSYDIHSAAFLLKFGRYTTLVIPKRFFSSEEEYIAFVSLLDWQFARNQTKQKPRAFQEKTI